MKFCWTTIMVSNMERSLRFYRDLLGLPVQKIMRVDIGMEIVFLGEEETKVELIFNDKIPNPAYTQNISMGFEVASLDETMNLMAANSIEVQGGPFQPNPHTKFFYVLDPDGVKIQFVENM